MEEPVKKKPTKVSETMLAPGPSEIAAGEVKARCLELMEVVAERHKEFVITKRGKPVARLVPMDAPRARKSSFGACKGMVTILGDIVGSTYTDEELRAFEAHSDRLLDG